MRSLLRGGASLALALCLPPHFTLLAAGGSAMPAPTVRVGPFEESPQIDGKGDDKVWGQSVEINDFIRFGSHQPVQQDEATLVRFGYDAQFLYVLAKCKEPLLTTVSQRQTEIVANAKERDGDVLIDDSILLLLKSPGGHEVFEFAVNTRGIVADAKSSADKLWEERDLGWNAEVKSAVTQGDGYWVVEMAIPWQEIAAKPPVSGEAYQVAIARLARGRREQSSWNPTSARGAHAPEGFAQLLFGATTTGLQLARPFSSFEAGKNELEVELSGGRAGAGIVISSEIASDSRKASVQRARTKVEVGPTPMKASHFFEVGEASAVSFAWSAYDAATLEPIYRSPRQTIPVQTSHLALTLSTEKPYRFFVNDQLLAEGEKADGAPLRVPLRTGANVLSLEVESGVASIQLKSAALGPQPIRWKIAKANSPGATTSKSDDATWETAPEAAITPGAPVEIGRRGEPAVLRHTILVRQTRVWPLPYPALYIAGNGVQQATFLTEGIPGRELRDWKFYFEMPSDIEAIGSTGFNANREEEHLNTPGKARYSFKSIDHAAPKMRHYSVTADKPITYQADRKPVFTNFELMLRLNSASLGDNPTKISYWSTANDGTVSELKQELPVLAAPPLNGRQPKKIVWQLWGGNLGIMDDDSLKGAVFSMAKAAGFTEVNSLGRRSLEHAQENGLGIQIALSFQPWALNMSEYVEKHPEAQLLNAKGTRMALAMCTSALLDEGWDFVGLQIKSYLQSRLSPGTSSSVVYDYEYDPLIGPHSCYCERCLSAFRSTSALASDLALTPQKIRESYAPQWVDFMARRVAQLFLQMKKAVHEVSPGLKFVAYSGYQTVDNPSRYGVDWRYVGELKAVDIASCGYGRSAEVIDATTCALPGIPVLFGELLTPYMVAGRVNPDVPSVQVTKATFLRRSLDATGGVLVYDRKPMDGRTWHAVGETTRLVAEHEDLFLAHRLERVAGQDPESIQLLRGEKESLLCVMNLRDKEQKFSFIIPEEFQSGTEYYRNQPVKGGEKIGIILKPGETAVYLLK